MEWLWACGTRTNNIRRFEEAQNKVQAGLEKIPNNFNLLNIASDAFRASKDLIKSLEYAELLATHHPKNWQSILKKSECLCELGKLDQAKTFLDQELKNNSANFSLSAKQLQLSKLFSSSDEIIDISSDIRLNFPERKEGFEETIKSRLSREVDKESIDEIRIEYRENAQKNLNSSMDSIVGKKYVQKFLDQFFFRRS